MEAKQRRNRATYSIGDVDVLIGHRCRILAMEAQVFRCLKNLTYSRPIIQKLMAGMGVAW